MWPWQNNAKFSHCDHRLNTKKALCDITIAILFPHRKDKSRMEHSTLWLWHFLVPHNREIIWTQHKINQWKANMQTGGIVSTRDGACLKEDNNFPHTLLSYRIWKLAVACLAVEGDWKILNLVLQELQSGFEAYEQLLKYPYIPQRDNLHLFQVGCCTNQAELVTDSPQISIITLYGDTARCKRWINVWFLQ